MSSCPALERFPDLPERMRQLPVDDRGFPVPWFVARKPDGTPFFPAMDPIRLGSAWHNSLCWVCGQPLGRFRTFVIGPMCAVNRTSAEPPSHGDCATFSARNCPFLTKPKMSRVPQDKFGAEGRVEPAGCMIDRNPGVALVWTTTKPSRFKVENGYLFDIGPPETVEWYAQGRQATRDEVMESIRTGLPFLEQMVQREMPGKQREAAQAELERRIVDALKLVPA